MRDPGELKFTPTHEWVQIKGSKVICGISDFAQARLSDITSVEMPEPDDTVYEDGEEIGAIESLRDSMDFHAPVSGRVTAINTELLSSPEMINEDPYGAGWIIEMKPARMSDLEDMLDIDEYEADLPEDDEDE